MIGVSVDERGDIMDWNELSGPQLKILREAILRSFPTVSRFDMFLSDELDKGSLANEVGPGSFEQQIHAYLISIQSEGWTDSLVDALQRQRGKNPWVRRLPDAIRAAGTSAPERLAAAPSMQLEKIVQGGGFADLRIWAQSLALVSAATCRIEFPTGQAQGTGLLVAPDLVLTNYHVVKRQLNKEASPADIVCRFGYARDANGLDEGTPYNLAAGDAWTLDASPFDTVDTGGAGIASASNLDYAVLRLASPLTDWKPIRVAANIALPNADLPVLIVQHPAGTPQALAIGKSLGTNENGSRFRYDADTLGGSSGSPVFNQRLELVALHHAGDPRSEIRAAYNQGIPIGLIVAAWQSKQFPPFWQ